MVWTGLSPRGRGNRFFWSRTLSMTRSIPAWAGEPHKRHARQRTARVYPRVGGGTRSPTTAAPPRKGLSPRGRGNPADDDHAAPLRGSIPAWAGEPRNHRRRKGRRKVYPRVGGGTYCGRPTKEVMCGLSPRGRGNRVDGDGTRAEGGSIPAWAGEPVACRRCSPACRVYPRVGGGTVITDGDKPAGNGLSPRGRGNPNSWLIPARSRRSIPAWAGEPGLRCRA